MAPGRRRAAAADDRLPRHPFLARRGRTAEPGSVWASCGSWSTARSAAPGVKVSPLCLGAMMFGGWGNPDHDDSRRHHPPRPRRRHQLHRHRRRVLGGRVRGDRRQGHRGPPRRGRARHQVPRPDGRRTPTSSGNSPALDHARVRGQPPPPRHRLHRPLPGAPARSRTPTSTRRSAALSDLVHQGKVRYLGSSTFPAGAIVEAQWVAERRGRERFVCEQPPYSMLVRGIEADVLPTCQRHGMGVIPGARSPAAGCRAAGARAPTT